MGLWLGTFLMGVEAAEGKSATGRIMKVLPHLVDLEGRVAVAPSLFQRDAYQAQLRQNPELVSTIRYDVNCKVSGRSRGTLALRLALRTTLRPESSPIVLETPVKRGVFGRSWQSLKLDPELYRAAGQVLAWRIELLDNGTVIGAQQSFLW